jgi:hypothetical protein
MIRFLLQYFILACVSFGCSSVDENQVNLVSRKVMQIESIDGILDGYWIYAGGTLDSLKIENILIIDAEGWAVKDTCSFVNDRFVIDLINDSVVHFIELYIVDSTVLSVNKYRFAINGDTLFLRALSSDNAINQVYVRNVKLTNSLSLTKHRGINTNCISGTYVLQNIYIKNPKKGNIDSTELRQLLPDSLVVSMNTIQVKDGAVFVNLNVQGKSSAYQIIDVVRNFISSDDLRIFLKSENQLPEDYICYLRISCDGSSAEGLKDASATIPKHRD